MGLEVALRIVDGQCEVTFGAAESKKITERVPQDEVLRFVGRRLAPAERGDGRNPRLAEPPSASPPSDLGDDLFQTVFHGRVRDRVVAELALARERRRTARLALDVEDPSLVALPWELLYHGDYGYLCRTGAVQIVRRVWAPPAQLGAVPHPPIRVLAVAAQPPGLPRLEVALERHQIEAELENAEREGMVEVRWIDGKRNALRRAAADPPWHVLHFVGHGERGALELTSDDGSGPDPVAGSDLRTLLPAGLQLVVLNACHGAAGALEGRFAGVAQTLASGGVPDVIAMQSAVADTDACDFAGVLYRELAQGRTVGKALGEARRAMGRDQADHVWATPVHYATGADRPLLHVPVTGIADRSDQMADFHRIAIGSRGPRILLIRGKGSIGKTTLLTEFGVQCPPGVRYLFVALNECRTVPAVLHALCSALDYRDLYRVRELLQPHTAGAQAWSAELVERATRRDGDQRDPLAALTHALFVDITALGGRIVLALDALDEAVEATRKWIETTLAQKVLATAGVAMVIAGRDTRALEKSLASRASRHTLGEIADATDWLAYVERRSLGLSQDFVRELVQKSGGDPVTTRQYLEFFAPRGPA
ncbi:MAG: CHAT domain-containing protein [Myxococcales bacterium]|nr:CHAT domain-containing protein [Myxococcales bacterium]